MPGIAMLKKLISWTSVALLVTAGSAFYSPVWAGQDAAATAAPARTRAEMEEFLRTGKVIRTRSAGKGVTNSLRVTLSDGRLTHGAHVQMVDVSKVEFKTLRGTELNFRDSYRFNIAGYLLDEILDLNMVPVSVERRIDGKQAAVTWWVDDVMVDEGERRKKKLEPADAQELSKQIHLMRVWDELIHNTDRNLGNIIWTKDWKLWLIDHTRAFRMNDRLINPKILQRCERGLLDKMRGLTADVLTKALGETMTKLEISALLARRDQIVKLFEQLVAARGEAAVLYTRTAQ